jgi:hypothetical protein
MIWSRVPGTPARYGFFAVSFFNAMPLPSFTSLILSYSVPIKRGGLTIRCVCLLVFAFGERTANGTPAPWV